MKDKHILLLIILLHLATVYMMTYNLLVGHNPAANVFRFAMIPLPALQAILMSVQLGKLTSPRAK